MSVARWALSWLIALAVVILRVTCRVRVYNDPRPELRKRGVPYTYSVLHAHQIARRAHQRADVLVGADAHKQGALSGLCWLGEGAEAGCGNGHQAKGSAKGAAGSHSCWPF